MTSLFLVRLSVDLRSLAAFAVKEKVVDDDQGYALHLALRRTFGSSAPQPFHLFKDKSPTPYLLGYVQSAKALQEAAALPSFDIPQPRIFSETVETRPMPESWRTGAHYGFETRVRPVIRIGPRARAARAAEGKPAVSERDVFLAACEKTEGPVDRSVVYSEWLVKKFEGVAKIGQLQLTSTQRVTTWRSSHGYGCKPHVTGYEALFRGTLEIQDPERFSVLLTRGIGRHTAFGNGMLLLKPAKIF